MHFDRMSWKRGWGRLRGGEGVEDTFGGFPRSAVRGGEEVEGVGRVEERAEFETGGVGLGAAFGGEFDAVVWRVLVDGAVFVAFGLGVADEDDEAGFSHCLGGGKVRSGGD